MKAWIVGPRGPGAYIALVYADTAAQARATLAGFYAEEDEYVDMRARRCPAMDGKQATRGVCEDEALLLESGEFWTCERHNRLAEEDLTCPECWAEERKRHDND
jgi:hypothetical protein